MASPFASNINLMIDQYVRNNALDSFTNLNLNRILHLITQLADANSGASSAGGNIVAITSANFLVVSGQPAINCPIPSLNNRLIRVYYEEANRFLEQDAAEWQPYTGGGFTILIPGFDATKNTYHFYVFLES